VDGWLGARPRGWLAQIGTVGLDPWRGCASAGRLAWPRHGGGGPLPRRPAGQHRGGPGPPSHPAGHPWPSGPYPRPAVPDRQAVAHRHRAGHPTRTGAATSWPGGRGSQRRGRGGLAGQGAASRRLSSSRPAGRPCCTRPVPPLVRWRWVAELSRLARTVRAWAAEILAWHVTNDCSNGPTEAINLLIKKVKRVGHGFRNFANYRLRLLLHCGVTWQTHQTARLRGRYWGPCSTTLPGERDGAARGSCW
jgi:hypothetical protein